MLPSASDKVKLFPKNFCKNSDLQDSVIPLPAFPSRTKLKLHNISVTPKMVKRVIMNLDSLKASGPDCILEVVLKNCEAELSYILAELFSMCQNESCFSRLLKGPTLVVRVFENVEESLAAKSYHPVSLLFVVGKVFEKLVKMGLLINCRNVAYFLISSMVLGLLNQLQIFRQLHLIELLWIVSLGLLEL